MILLTFLLDSVVFLFGFVLVFLFGCVCVLVAYIR